MNEKSKFQCDTLRKLKMLVLFCTVSFALMAQTKSISGVVKSSEDGESLIGVTVMVKGTSTGTITNIDGKYSITVPNSDAVLVFSMIGMKKEELKVGANTTLNVTLSQDSKVMEEVVVTGYSTQKKADLTGAVTVVDVNDLKKVNNANAMQSLQGKVAGMVITTDGSPSGSGTTVRLRGIGTLGNNDPLYIIDGVPTKEGMNQLNPNDIESIQVLKDASSSTIYGSRAANGVIIITTKKGKVGVLQISANARTSYSFYSSKLDVLNAQQYGQAFWQGKVNDGLDPNANSISYQFDWAKDANGVPVLNKVILPDYLNVDKTLKTADTDWFKAVSQVGVSRNYDVTLSNGSEKGHSLVSVDYTKNDGIIKTTNFERVTARINTDYKLLHGKLVVGENLSLSRSSEVANNVLDPALQALPIIPIHTVDGIGWGGPVGGMNDRQNPVRLLEDNKQNNVVNLRIFGNLFADAELMKHLHFKTNLGLDYTGTNYRNLQYTYQSGYLSNATNTVTNSQRISTNWIWSNTLNYQFTKGKHAFDALVGTELVYHGDEWFYATGQNFELQTPDYMYLNAGTGQKGNGGLGSVNTLSSYFGKVNYVFDEKYLASATLRYDGSSQFGKNNRYATFPAFSLGWRISQEGFIKDKVPAISNLKLRLGWGQTGNQEIANNATQTLYTTNYNSTTDVTWNTPNSTAYSLTGVKSGTLPSGYLKIQSGNDNLKWETTTQTNIGLDFGFFDEKLYGSLDYFIKDTKDILVQPAYIAVVGDGGSQWLNGASMNNVGFEMLLGYRGRIGSDFKFDITGNIGTYKNKITQLPDAVVNTYGGNGLGDNILGHAIGTRYGYIADGLFTTQEEVANSAVQNGKGLGRLRFKDINGDGVIDTKDQTWVQIPHPDFTYGLNFSFDYKGFDLNVFFQGVGRIDVENVVKYSTDFWSVRENNSNKGTRLLGAWSPTNTSSTIPAITSSDANAEGRFSTYFIENGAYLKLRNLQIGYTIPKNITEKFKVSNIHMYVSGQNLLTIKSKSFTGIDPESPSYGYPIPTTLTAGLNVSF